MTGRLIESPHYTIFYDRGNLMLNEVVVANDHLHAIEALTNKYGEGSISVRLVLKGTVEPLWML